MAIEIKEDGKTIAKIGSNDEAFFSKAKQESEMTIEKLEAALKMEHVIYDAICIKLASVKYEDQVYDVKGGDNHGADNRN